MKRSLIALALLVTFVTMAGAARADEEASPNRPGLDLGIRAGYALPFGRVTGGTDQSFSDGISGAVPLVVDALYRANPQLSLGLLFQYAFAQVNGNGNSCGNGGFDCSSSVIHLAIQGIFRPPVSGSFAPWLGLGTGYEWFSLSASQAGLSATGSYNGFEFLILQAGGDIQLAPQLGLGPFVMLSVGQYRNETITGNIVQMSGSITDTAVHEWLEFGVRGTFSL